MTQILHGERISKHGKVRLGCSAVLFDKTHENILLTRRTDNGLWCLPGGMVDAGESVSEACEREVIEETGLQVRVAHLTGVYSDPDQVIVYPDGNMSHVVVLNFEVRLVGGEICLSDETTAVNWFPLREAVEMNLFHDHVQHILDALAKQAEAFIR
jgi:ADP-ribose pyrophosphatase YjhB (NUDIX family)